MSQVKLLGVLLLTAVTEIGGIALGRQLGFSLFASVGAGLVPALLVAFPLMKQWSGRQLSFRQWVMTVVMITGTATLLHIFIG
jgi:hypothetical protein